MYKINIRKLYDLMSLKYENCTIWTEDPISLSSFADETKNLVPLREPYGDLDNTANLEWGKIEHLRRILYFVENPNEIKGIQLDNEIFNDYILPKPIIVDGNHRMFAALHLNFKYVHCRYGGRKDVLDYLTDKTNLKPTDWQ
ncbi:hypothetical protein P4284_23755 [Bacillus swezeyi]|uniref:hypothetical protein n=1 Tax=Bacillus swezeyi TaxID=1925020 RepID=UPI002E233E58|nr:hypothetical protein [Bacillus swezeyi]MED2979668.1 hypothetical protein [Bacillus swezeyi]